MHYRNGREAKNGDKIVRVNMETGKIEAYGVLYDAVSENSFCNGYIAPEISQGNYACICDCLHIDDVAEILKEKGLDKRLI